MIIIIGILIFIDNAYYKLILDKQLVGTQIMTTWHALYSIYQNKLKYVENSTYHPYVHIMAEFPKNQQLNIFLDYFLNN